MTVASSTHLKIEKGPGLNRCLLKASLVGIIQDTAKKVNDENAMVKVLVKDYVSHNSDYIVTIVFPYHDIQFKHLMNPTQPDESLLFVIGQLEVIQDDLYVYTVETSYIDIHIADKKKFLIQTTPKPHQIHLNQFSHYF